MLYFGELDLNWENGIVVIVIQYIPIKITRQQAELFLLLKTWVLSPSGFDLLYRIAEEVITVSKRNISYHPIISSLTLLKNMSFFSIPL